MKKILPILIVLSILNQLSAGGLKKLTFDQVYRQKGEQLVKPIPFSIEWIDDEHYLSQKKGKLFKVHARSGKSRLFLDPQKYNNVLKQELSLLGAADQTKDREKFLFVIENDIFLFLRKEKQIIQITRTPGKEKNPVFSPDGKKIAYTAQGDLYCYKIDSQKTCRLTTDGNEEILNGYASWVYYEEILGRRSGYKAFWWSPNSEKIVFLRFDQGKVPIFPIFRAAGSYGELEKQRYPKPGFPNPQVKIGIADLKKKSIDWIDFSDQGDHYLAFPIWNETSDRMYFQWMNRDQDFLKIFVYDFPGAKISPIYEERQSTWVEFFDTGDFFLLKNGDIALRSSKNGWFHIYYISKDGREKQLTSGEWSVSGIECIDQAGEIIYFSAQKEDSTKTDFYKTSCREENIIRLTDMNGSHRVSASPAGKYFFDNYSSITVPGRIELRDNKGKLIRKIADSDSAQRNDYDLAKVELFRIPTEDGYKLPAMWLLPPGFDQKRKYPVVFAVYGGPGAPSVRNSYPQLARFFLAQQDIIVFSVDHRGSGHFGKKGMALMHRYLGKWEMYDYSQAAGYLRTLPFVDGEKIGITGGSYGGYVTALALTKESRTFGYGIAGASVIDWQLYDSVYTERYMDTPKENPDGYKNASVLTYIDKYRSGSLRITHGTMDDNVHMQNTIQFLNNVLDSGKSLELMLYPGDRHGYSGNKRMDSNRGDLNFWLRKFYGKTIED